MCDAEDGLQAILLITQLETGDTLAWCGPHAADWMASTLLAMNPEIDQEPAGVAESDGAGAGEGAGTRSTPRPKRGRTRAQGASAALASEASPFPDPSPVDS